MVWLSLLYNRPVKGKFSLKFERLSCTRRSRAGPARRMRKHPAEKDDDEDDHLSKRPRQLNDVLVQNARRGWQPPQPIRPLPSARMDTHVWYHVLSWVSGKLVRFAGKQEYHELETAVLRPLWKLLKYITDFEHILSARGAHVDLRICN